MTPTTSTNAPGLPATISDFLEAHAARDVDSAVRRFSSDVEVRDDGHTYRGIDEVRSFLQDAASEFSYTTTLLGSERIDDESWLVRNRIEGDFPGGVADLGYEFTLDGERITKLVIAP